MFRSFIPNPKQDESESVMVEPSKRKEARYMPPWYKELVEEKDKTFFGEFFENSTNIGKVTQVNLSTSLSRDDDYYHYSVLGYTGELDVKEIVDSAIEANPKALHECYVNLNSKETSIVYVINRHTIPKEYSVDSDVDSSLLYGMKNVINKEVIIKDYPQLAEPIKKSIHSIQKSDFTHTYDIRVEIAKTISKVVPVIVKNFIGRINLKSLYLLYEIPSVQSITVNLIDKEPCVTISYMNPKMVKAEETRKILTSTEKSKQKKAVSRKRKIDQIDESEVIEEQTAPRYYKVRRTTPSVVNSDQQFQFN